MAVDYDSAFESVIQRPWLGLPEDQRDAAAIPKRQGQLSADTPDAYALHDTFHYQRGHADVFREAYQAVPHARPKRGQRLLVVDIGAGAATVAVAIGEALGRKPRQRIDYLAFDPHPMMRRLGQQLLHHLDADFRSASYVASLDAIDFSGCERVLFTFSYVSHQTGVGQEDIDRWASLIQRAAGHVDPAVELIYTTAARLTSIEPRLTALGPQLEQAGFKRSIDPIRIQVPQRYPDVAADTGRIRWSERSAMWQVDAERWTLRS